MSILGDVMWERSMPLKLRNNSGEMSGYDAFHVSLAKDLEGLWFAFDSRTNGLIRKEGVSYLLNEETPWDPFARV